MKKTFRSTVIAASITAAFGAFAPNANAALSVSGSVGGAPTGAVKFTFDDLTPGSASPLTTWDTTNFYSLGVQFVADSKVVSGAAGGQYAAPWLSGGNGAGFVNGGGNQANQARIQVQLLPRAERKQSAQQIAQQLRPQLLRFPNYRAFVNVPSSLQIGGRMGNSNYNVTVQSADTDELYLQAQRLSDAMDAQVPEIQDVSNDLEIRSPRVSLVIDRDKAAAVGLNATQIENTLSTSFGPKWTSTIYGARTQYRVLIELEAVVQDAAWRARPARRRRLDQGDRRAPERQPHRAAAVRLGVVLAGARRVAG